MNFIVQNRVKIAISALFLGLFGISVFQAYAASAPSFAVFPQNITVGETATLTWFADNNYYSECRLSGIEGGGFPFPTNFSYSVNPIVTTAYTLVCTGNEGFSNQTLTLAVGAGSAASPVVYNTNYPNYNYTNPPYSPYPNYPVYYSQPNYGLVPAANPSMQAVSPSNSFTAACAISPSSVAEQNKTVSFGAAQSGGVSPFIYRWTGDIIGSQQVENIAFPNTGIKTAKVTITDARGISAEGSCSVTIVENAPQPVEKPAPVVVSKKPTTTAVQVGATNCKTVTVCIDMSGNVTQKDTGGSGVYTPTPKDENKIETAQNDNDDKTFFLASIFGSGGGSNGGGTFKNFAVYLLPIIAAVFVIFIGYMVVRFTKKT